MKEYIKPEAKFVKFDSETVATSGAGNGTIGIISSDVSNPWGE